MTYKDILKEFSNKFPNAEVEDYRPACGLYIDGVDDCTQIPNAIVVWLTDGSKVIYISGKCASKKIIEFKEKNMAENNRCEKCSKYGWEDGDTLYEYNSWDGGIGFDYVRIHYCPICGNKLYKDSEEETME